MRQRIAELVVNGQSEGMRLDLFVAQREASLSRSAVQRLIRQGFVAVGGRREKSSYPVRAGEVVRVQLPPIEVRPIEAEPIPLCVVYEDRELLVIDKPAGLTVHPGAGRSSGTLVNALLHHGGPLSSLGGDARPGIVHRLDKDTSGLMVVAKSDAAHRSLASQLAAREMSRTYLAVVHGTFDAKEGKVEVPIGRDLRDRKRFSVRTRKPRWAATHYRVLETYQDLYSLLRVELETGRTHQIRVHLAYVGHPVAGDRAYGRKGAQAALPPSLRQALQAVGRQALHAERLRLIHPLTGVRMCFYSPLPPDLQALVNVLRQWR